MPINADKLQTWKSDIAHSVDFYNQWFMRFAPKAYRTTRVDTTKQVEEALQRTKNLTDIEPEILRSDPSVLPILRMATAPPIARDRLIGLAYVSPNLVRSMELEKRIPPQMKPDEVKKELRKMGKVIRELADKDIFPWLDSKKNPSKEELYRAATIVADRLCGAVADPIIRNAQEKRQLASMKKWLEDRKYIHIESRQGLKLDTLKPGTFSFRFNVGVKQAGRTKEVNIPIDAIVMARGAKERQLPILPSPRYLKQDMIRGDKKGNPVTEKPRFLLSCHLPPQQVKCEFPALWKYLETGIQQKVHEGYLCQHRSPWYSQEDRPASPFLCTYMGRHDSPKGSPFRFILNLSKATAANVYLFLYPKPPLAQLIEKYPRLTKRIWEGLNDISSESLVSEGRVYGGGLHKMEPRELANASAESVLELIPELRAQLVTPQLL